MTFTDKYIQFHNTYCRQWTGKLSSMKIRLIEHCTLLCKMAADCVYFQHDSEGGDYELIYDFNNAGNCPFPCRRSSWKIIQEILKISYREVLRRRIFWRTSWGENRQLSLSLYWWGYWNELLLLYDRPLYHIRSRGLECVPKGYQQ